MNGATKNDKKDNKSAMEFVSPVLMLGIGDAMGAGKIKYGDWNFLKGHGRLQLCAAILRHTFAIMRGELIDADTTALFGRDIYHWDCIGASCNMMVWQREYGTLVDDKPEVKVDTTPTATERTIELATDFLDTLEIKVGDFITPGSVWKKTYPEEAKGLHDGGNEVTYVYEDGDVSIMNGNGRESCLNDLEYKIIRRV